MIRSGRAGLADVLAEGLDLLLLVGAQVVGRLLGVLVALGLVGEVDEDLEALAAVVGDAVRRAGVAELLERVLALAKSSPALVRPLIASQKSSFEASSGAPQAAVIPATSSMVAPTRTRRIVVPTLVANSRDSATLPYPGTIREKPHVNPPRRIGGREGQPNAAGSGTASASESRPR
jgi:hypothetical protein